MFLHLIAFKVVNKYGNSGVIYISALFDPIYHYTCQRVSQKATF